MFVNDTTEVEVLRSVHSQIVDDVAKAIGDKTRYMKSKLTLTPTEEAALSKHFGPTWASSLADSVKQKLGISKQGWTTAEFAPKGNTTGVSVVFVS